MSDRIIWISVFASAAALDMLWVLYVRSVDRGAIFRAVLTSMAIGLVSAFGMLNLVDDRALIVPYVAGLGFGTWLGMLFKTKKEIA